MKNAALIVLGLMSLSPFTAQASDIREEALQPLIQEIDALDASIASDLTADGRETRAMQKILRKFDRQYDRFARKVSRLVKNYDEAELREMLANYHVYTGSVLAELGLDGKMEIPSDTGSLRMQLMAIANPVAKAMLRAQLIHDVHASGSARAYLRKVRTGLHGMNACIWKRAVGTVGFAALAVSGFTGGLSGSVVVNFLAFFLGGVGGVPSMAFFGNEISNGLSCRLERRAH